MPNTSPAPMAKLTSSTARKVAGSPARRLGLANATARFSTSMSGASAMVDAAHAVHCGKLRDDRPCLPARIARLAAARGEHAAVVEPRDPRHLAGDLPQPLDT